MSTIEEFHCTTVKASAGRGPKLIWSGLSRRLPNINGCVYLCYIQNHSEFAFLTFEASLFHKAYSAKWYIPVVGDTNCLSYAKTCMLVSLMLEKCT